MTDIDLYMPKGGVQGHAGQATMVEASRAMEEVRALVVVARQFPRDIPGALRRIEETFRVKGMADRSFYSYPKGKGTVVSGSTIHLAKAVAQAWQNITYGIDELSRVKGQSEMRAWAWDLETNQRTSTTFIVEHAMDVGGTLKELASLRDIYENNANMANRRLRAQIESVIPAYVIDIAKDIASTTLRKGGGEPLPVRVAKAIEAFAGLGVQLDQIEAERGRASGQWTEIDLGHLRILIRSIQQGEITVADAFPPADVSPEQARPVTPVQVREPSPEPEQAPPVVDVPLPGDELPQNTWEMSDPWDADAAQSWPTVRKPGGER